MSTQVEPTRNTAVAENVVWFDIPVVDLERAIAFYGAVLNVSVQRADSPHGSLGVFPHSQMIVGGCLVPTADHHPTGSGPLLYFNCAGRLAAAVKAACDHGGQVLTPVGSIAPHGWRAILTDSEGNCIALHAPSAS